MVNFRKTRSKRTMRKKRQTRRIRKVRPQRGGGTLRFESAPKGAVAHVVRNPVEIDSLPFFTTYKRAQDIFEHDF